VNDTIDMSKNLSRDAAELLQVIERAPGHTRNELMKLAGISRRVWSNLSGELKAAKVIRTESAKVNGKVVYRWYKAGTTESDSKIATKPKKKKNATLKAIRKKDSKVKSHIRRGARTPSSSWSVTEVRLLTKLYKAGYSDDMIVKEFAKDDHCANRTAKAMSKKRSDLGLVFGKGRKTKSNKTKKAKKTKQLKDEVLEVISNQPKEATLPHKEEVLRSGKEPRVSEMEAVSLIIKGLTQLGLGSGVQDHAHHEYATVRDVQDSFNKVASALDELNARLVVVEETLASMQTAQSEVDNEQNQALRGMLQRMSDFTIEMEKRLNDN